MVLRCADCTCALSLTILMGLLLTMRNLVFALSSIAMAMGQPATVPLIVEGNAPMVELEFSSPKGVRRARFLVDTGGGAFILGSQLMADIGAKAVGPPEKEEVTLVPLAPMVAKLGSMTLDLTGVNVLGAPDDRGPSKRNTAEGLIPGCLLRKYEVIFDYPARQFTLAKPGAINPRGIKIPTPISSPSGFPRIELQIGGETYGFLLDSGASFTMISRTVLGRWAKANPTWPTATGAVSFANMFGGELENEGFSAKPTSYGRRSSRSQLKTLRNSPKRTVDFVL